MKTIQAFLVLLITAVLSLAAYANQQKPAADEALVEFKKYYGGFKENAQKIEAILALDGKDSPELVATLLPIFEDPEFEVHSAVLRVLSKVKDEASVNALIAALKVKSPQVKAGAVEALGVGKQAAAAAPLKAFAIAENNPEVKATIAMALGRIGDKTTNDVLIKYLDDSKDNVKVAACDGLALIGDPTTAGPVLNKLSDKEWRVRAAAIAALATIRADEVVPKLIETLDKEEGRLLEDAARTLERLTGMNLGPDAQAWKQWWGQMGKVYHVPSEKELKEAKDRQRKAAMKYGLRKDVVEYNGITSPSKRILFVIDQSGSMEDEILDRKRFEGRDYSSFSKFEIVKQELTRTIRKLDPKVRFNILTFATNVFPWKKELVPADILHKTAAEQHVARMQPIGGSSKAGLASAGLTGAAGLQDGQTNTYLALMTAIGGPGGKIFGDVPEDIDTIFFLSDGRPSTGKMIEPDDILLAVREANKLKKIVIHTIAIGEFQKDFMEKLAKESGGVFVDLGK